MKIIILLITSFLVSELALSQSIRKDHKHMVQVERDAFVQALYLESDLISNFGDYHASFFNTIHFRSEDIIIEDNYNPNEDIFLP